MKNLLVKGVLATFILSAVAITAIPSTYAHGHHNGGHGCYQRNDCPYNTNDCPYYNNR